jgi:hypothetical protein
MTFNLIPIPEAIDELIEHVLAAATQAEDDTRKLQIEQVAKTLETAKRQIKHITNPNWFTED